MREQFEKLPEIAERLHTVFYNEDLNQYHAAMINSGLSVKYIQGAWYTYQEQQKNIDTLNKRIEDALNMLETETENSWKLWKEKADMYEQGAANAYERSYWTLKGNK